MLIAPGSIALSPFRRHKLLAALTAQVPGIQGLEAVHVHFVRCSRDPAPEERARLDKLLGYGEQWLPADPEGELYLVVPRPGTISPWSSKATDILHNCGLAWVERIERGVAYFIRTGGDVNPDGQARMRSLLHDRMLEVVLGDFQDALILFSEAEPRPVRELDISTDASGALARANREWGLALSADEIEYLAANYADMGRNPTDMELMMFAQANSE
ncbi:MAG TPA: phosphoribosylformylglycinamidine synthase, partial [Thiolinea sp.]|nr:phosphoribosylformylglycinamidine synthase [Thiolinea sp.]